MSSTPGTPTDPSGSTAASTPTGSDLHLPAGTTGRGNYETIIDPGARDGWVHTGLRVLALGPGESEIFTANSVEAMIVPLNGGCEVSVGGEQHTLRGRTDVFASATDVLYVPVGSQPTITSADGGRFAVATAVATGVHPVALIRAEDVSVEIRGGGNMTRMVRNFGTVGAFDAMDSLIACEVITPGGNWSSYPAHKHDESVDDGEHRESELEEIYYYEIQDSPDGGPGFGFHQTTSSGESTPIDVLVRGAQRRHRARPARLAWPLCRRSRARHVLPQRHGRTGPGARLEHHRPSRADLGARHLGRRRHRPPPRRRDPMSETPTTSTAPAATEQIALPQDVRVGIIGVGRMGADHVERIRGRIKGARVSVISDYVRETAEKVAAATPGSRVVDTPEEVIAADDVDAILIASPGAFHRDQTLAAIAAGKPVLCEKPLAMNPQDAYDVVARRGGVGREVRLAGLHAPLRRRVRRAQGRPGRRRAGHARCC